MVMYEEYKNAITAPRAETSAYFEAAGDHQWVYFGFNWTQLTIATGGKGRLDVGSQRDITSGPSEGDGNECSSGPPGPADILLGDGTEVW